MSNYYSVKGLKVRVSDHEANVALNGSNDINLYIVDACGSLISVEAQIEAVCEKRNLNIEDFNEIINEFKDGSYSKNHFAIKSDEGDDEGVSLDSLKRVTDMKMNTIYSNSEKLEGYSINGMGKEAYAQVTAIHEATGVSKSFIKKYFNLI